MFVFQLLLVACSISVFLSQSPTTTDSYGYLSKSGTPQEHSRNVEHHSNECGGYIDGDQMSDQGGVLTSPNYPNLYPPGITCNYTIKAGKGKRVQIEFEDFDVTETDGCHEDYLFIASQDESPPGIAENSPDGPRLCGTLLPKPIVSEGDVIYLSFKSSSSGETCRGFSVRYSFKEVLSSCGQEISSQEFDFVNPEYPNPIANETFECHLEISHECGTEMCQIRLDFDEFLLQPPTLGDCIVDRFIVRSNNPPPILCGDNSGQHVYINVKGRSSTQIHVLLNPIYPKPIGHDDLNYGHRANYSYEIKDNRRWRIRVQQIPCDCRYDTMGGIPPKAPTGCLQYHTKMKGNIKSFNYDGFKWDLEPCWNGTERECETKATTGHLNNLDYNVCIERPEGHCGIKYASKDKNSFQLSGAYNPGQINYNVNMYGSSSCKDDHLIIPNGWFVSAGKKKKHDRYCGTGFIPVSSFSPPFLVGVKTDKEEFSSNDIGKKGFHITYSLIPCSNVHMYQ